MLLQTKNEASVKTRDQYTNLLFLHIPKCGGTSFTQLITKQLGECRYFQNGKALESNLQQDFGNIPAIGGHFYHFEVRGLFPGRKRIVLLRDPLQRLISSYKYAHFAVMTEPDKATKDQRAMTAMTFEDYFRSENSRSEKHMAMFMLGLRSTDKAREIEMSLLFRQACQNLGDYKVGTVENLDEFVKSIPELQSEVREPTAIPKENVSEDRSVSPEIELDEGFLAECREDLKYDFLFYDYARFLSNDQIGSKPDVQSLENNQNTTSDSTNFMGRMRKWLTLQPG